jgi:signal peptidase II
VCALQAAGGATLNADEATDTELSQPARSGPRRIAVAVLAVTALLAVTIDQWTKHLSTENLDPREPVRILGGLIYLSLIRNGGAAFSLGSGYTWVFPLITLCVVSWILWMTLRLRSVPWAVSLGLVLGGALGNLGDRLFRAPGPFLGHVVDMISMFAPYGERFAVFNIADSCLSVGVCLAVLLELTGRQRDGTRLVTTKKSRAADPSAADVSADSAGEKTP